MYLRRTELERTELIMCLYFSSYKTEISNCKYEELKMKGNNSVLYYCINKF